MQIGVNTLMVQLSADTRMSVLLLGSSHIHRLKHYVNKLQQQEFNLDDNIIIKLFGINGGRIGNNDHCRRYRRCRRLILNKSNQCILLFILVEII